MRLDRHKSHFPSFQVLHRRTPRFWKRDTRVTRFSRALKGRHFAAQGVSPGNCGIQYYLSPVRAISTDDSARRCRPFRAQKNVWSRPPQGLRPGLHDVAPAGLFAAGTAEIAICFLGAEHPRGGRLAEETVGADSCPLFSNRRTAVRPYRRGRFLEEGSGN